MTINKTFKANTKITIETYGNILFEGKVKDAPKEYKDIEIVQVSMGALNDIIIRINEEN